MSAAAGATPCPQITSTRARSRLHRTIGRAPPGPFWSGSAVCSTKPAAAAASKALPPRSRIVMPVGVASQCVVATTPNVPTISGRDVIIGRNRSAARTSGGGLRLGQRRLPDDERRRGRAPARHGDGDGGDQDAGGGRGQPDIVEGGQALAGRGRRQ